MITIYKYKLSDVDSQVIEGDVIQFLDIQVQNGVTCLWALVDTNVSRHIPVHEIHIFGTGHDIPHNILSSHEYLETYQLYDGSFIGHVFVPKL